MIRRLLVEKYEIDNFWVTYTNKIPKGDYLVFPVDGYTVTMRHPGVPTVVDSSDPKFDIVTIRYDFDPMLGRGDNRYPREGDQLAWMVQIPNYEKRISVIEQTFKEMRGVKKKINKPTSSPKT